MWWPTGTWLLLSFVMRCARGSGDSWSAVGSALDMTAHHARDWYENKINA